MFAKNKKFAEAYSDYYPVVFGTVQSKVGSLEDAEDICQEIFVKFNHKLDKIDNYRKWLYGALRLEVMAYWRKKKPDSADVEDIFGDVSLSFVNGFRDTRIMIEEALEEMENSGEEKDRALFEMVAVQDYTYEEAAHELGFSKRQVRYRYGLIVERLQDYFKKRGIKNLEELL